jgi:hypothetical protein
VSQPAPTINIPVVQLCVCGCQRPARPGSRYHQDIGPGNCKGRLFEITHPRLDLTGLRPAAAGAAAQMVKDAIAAVKQGFFRATVDASHSVKHEKDSRPSNRIRLGEVAWEKLQGLASRRGLSASAYVAELVEEADRLDGREP